MTHIFEAGEAMSDEPRYDLPPFHLRGNDGEIASVLPKTDRVSLVVVVEGRDYSYFVGLDLALTGHVLHVGDWIVWEAESIYWPPEGIPCQIHPGGQGVGEKIEIPQIGYTYPVKKPPMIRDGQSGE